jgi:hypothetical protein
MQSAKIDWLGLHLDFEKTHSDAGWEKVPDELVRKRYVLYHQWLAANKLILADPAKIDENHQLYMSQVTPIGKKFLKIYHDRFISKMDPHRTLEDDQKYLEKSLKTFNKKHAESDG